MLSKKKKNNAVNEEITASEELTAIKETVPEPATQEFVAVSQNRQGPIAELVRTSSVGYSVACRRFYWFSLHNMHLIVYTMFFLVLAIFSFYYGFYGNDKMLCIFSGITAAFMLYVIVGGPKLFAEGMSFDEEKREGTLCCKFYQEELSVTIGEEETKISYSSVVQLTVTRHYIYLRLKNNKTFKSGIVMERPTSDSTVADIEKAIKP